MPHRHSLPLQYTPINQIPSITLTIAHSAASSEDIIHYGTIYLATTYNAVRSTSSGSLLEDAADTATEHMQFANLCLYSPSHRKILWEQKLFTGMDILVISPHQFGFKCQNQYITVDAKSHVNVFVENVRYVKRCLDLERIKMHKQEIDAHETSKRKKKGRDGGKKSAFRLFSSSKKKKRVDISKPKNVEKDGSASYGEEKGFVPWDYLPHDYHPMLIANGITEKDWNLYGAKLMPVLEDFTTRTAVESVRIQSGEVKHFAIQTPRTTATPSAASEHGGVGTPLANAQTPLPETEQTPLPEGWARYYDDEEKLYYYFNEIYDYSQWDAPTRPAHLCTEPKEETTEQTADSGEASTSTAQAVEQPPQQDFNIPTEEAPESATRYATEHVYPTSATPQSAVSRHSTEYASTASTPHSVQTPTATPTEHTASAPPPLLANVPVPPPISGLLSRTKSGQELTVTASTPTGAPPPFGAPPPAPPIGALNIAMPAPTSRIRRGSRAAPPRQKPVTPATKPPDLLASIRQFSKENLRHVKPDEHKAPDLSKMAPNQKLSLMEVLKSRLTDLRDQVEGASSGSSSDSDSDDDASDQSW